MTHLTKITLSTLLAISLSACSGDSEPATTADHNSQDHAKVDQVEIDHGTMDHAADPKDSAMSDTGHTTGKLISVSPDGQSATIQHEAIDGVGMGAMTMGFDITSGVDLSALSPEDLVSFMVKRGRDGSYRITAICSTETDGDDCLSAHMDHPGQ